jgi:hypothetical protein
MAAITSELCEMWRRRVSCSSAKTMPPSGVLKAAAMPAAAPATIRSWASMPECGDSQRGRAP